MLTTPLQHTSHLHLTRAHLGRLGLLGLTLACLSGALGCSLVVDAQREQCSTNLDCQIRGPAFAEAMCVENLCQTDPTWACADSAETLEQQAVEAPLSVVNLLNGAAYAGVHATLYSALDFDLETPLDTADTDAEGKATLSVPAGLDVFVALEAEGVIENGLFYPPPPITAESGFGQLYAGPPGASGGLINLIGAVPQAGRGIALTVIRDCVGTGGPGATIVYTGETQGSTPFYSFNGIASSSARALDATGQAGIVNLRPGVVGVEVRSGDKLVSTTSVLVRAESVTQVTLLPGMTGSGFDLD
jgi:hypothetical protein